MKKQYKVKWAAAKPEAFSGPPTNLEEYVEMRERQTADDTAVIIFDDLNIVVGLQVEPAGFHYAHGQVWVCIQRKSTVVESVETDVEEMYLDAFHRSEYIVATEVKGKTSKAVLVQAAFDLVRKAKKMGLFKTIQGKEKGRGRRTHRVILTKDPRELIVQFHNLGITAILKLSDIFREIRVHLVEPIVASSKYQYEDIATIIRRDRAGEELSKSERIQIAFDLLRKARKGGLL